MIAGFLRFASVGIICRRIGAVEQMLDRVNALRLSFKFKRGIGSLELGRQLQLSFCMERIFCFVRCGQLFGANHLARKCSKYWSQLSMAFLTRIL